MIAPTFDENHMATNSYKNNGGTMKPDSHPAPSRNFAGMFTELESTLANDRRDWFNNRHAMLLDNLVACIREQQAALKEMVRVYDSTSVTSGPAAKQSRAVLAKWRIE